LILWRSIYRHNDRFYVDAIRTGLNAEPIVYEGTSVDAITLNEMSQGIEGSVLASDLDRFNHFSDGYLAYYPENPNVIGDLRYALLPQSVLPLWGIRIDQERPDQHVPFENFREISEEDRQRLIRMLRGQSELTEQ